MKKIVLFVICLGLLFSFASASEAGEWKGYKWENAYERNQIAEKIFRADRASGKHPNPNTYQCKYPIAAISYAFEKMESNSCAKGAGGSNNCHSMHIGSCKYGECKFAYKRQPEWGYLKGPGQEPLRNYPNELVSTVDFMYLYYYGYGCNLSFNHVKTYISTSHTNAYVTQYRNTLFKKIEDYMFYISK